MKNLDKIIREAIDSTLSENGLNNDLNSNTTNKELVSESYVVEAGKFKLQTELLSSKTKKSHLDLLDGYTKRLNLISRYPPLPQAASLLCSFLHRIALMPSTSSVVLQK